MPLAATTRVTAMRPKRLLRTQSRAKTDAGCTPDTSIFHAPEHGVPYETAQHVNLMGTEYPDMDGFFINSDRNQMSDSDSNR